MRESKPLSVDDATFKAFSDHLRKKGVDSLMAVIGLPSTAFNSMFLGYADGLKGIERTKRELSRLGVIKSVYERYRQEAQQ